MQESPGHPRHLLGDGHTGLIDPNPRHQLPNPGTLGIRFVLDMADHRVRAMNQEPSDIAIATFGDPTEDVSNLWICYPLGVKENQQRE